MVAVSTWMDDERKHKKILNWKHFRAIGFQEQHIEVKKHHITKNCTIIEKTRRSTISFGKESIRNSLN